MQNPKTEQHLDLLEEKVVTHSIILYNDDFNTFDHVISCLIQICSHEIVQAEQCAWIVHTNGKCIVKIGEYQQLEPLCTSLLDKGLSATIE
jgi:ATP-dependent Clp protease adaptor protein ClpS